MKQEKNTETKAESQNGQGIQDAFPGMYQTISWAQPNYIAPPVTHSNHLRSGQGDGFCIGKAPPGNARSPGAARGHPPENKAGPPGQAEPAPSPLSFGREGPGVSQKNKKYTTMNINILTMNQYFINKPKFNFLQTFNFFIMKKQILILAFLVLAIFASVNKSYGQLPARPVNATCLPNDALHPVAGTPYTYQITVPDPTTPWDTKKYTWFVTQDPNFIVIDATTKLPVLKYTSALGAEKGDNSSLLMFPTAAADVTNYASVLATTTSSISLTWKSFGYVATKPVFVVINVAGSVTTGCTDISNLKVYEIIPVFAFTLDIENLTRGGALPGTPTYGGNIDNCISAIQTAKYDAVLTKGIIYDFGADTMYYEVNAANWFDRWELSAKVGGLTATQLVKLDWAYAPATRPITFKTAITNVAAPNTWNAITAASLLSAMPATGFTSTTLVAPKNAGGKAVDQAGESIIIRMVVKHSNTDEGIADEPLTLAVDGILYHETVLGNGIWTVKGAATEGDINIVAGALPAEVCPWYDGFANDIANQTIKARPTITDAISDTPNPTNYLPIK